MSAISTANGQASEVAAGFFGHRAFVEDWQERNPEKPLGAFRAQEHVAGDRQARRDRQILVDRRHALAQRVLG
jgi:hypothetical protein